MKSKGTYNTIWALFMKKGLDFKICRGDLSVSEGIRAPLDREMRFTVP